MGEGIDLPTLSHFTGIPQGTLRCWVSKHHIAPIPRTQPARYNVADLKPYLLAWAARQDREAKAA
jgi:hypothetical protein